MFYLLRRNLIGFSKCIILLGALLFSTKQVQAQMHHGNLIVCSPTGGTSAASVVKLYQFTPGGTLVDSTVIPSTGASELTTSGSATSEGFISLSAEKDRIVLVGYAAAAGTASVASGNANREIATIDSTETYTLQYSQAVLSTKNARGGTAYGSNFFETGSAAGIYLMNSSSLVETISTNNRNIGVYAGNVYFTSGSSPYLGVSQMGTGISTATGQLPTLIASSSSTANCYAFSISPDGNTCYIADATAGISKLTRSGNTGTFTAAGYTVYATPCSGICVDYTTSNPTIYATTSDGLSLIKFQDAGSTVTSVTTLATTTATQYFRGITFTPSTYGTVSGTASICSGGNTTLTFNGNPNGLISYKINGGATQTIQLDSAYGQATLNTGALTSTTTYSLVSIATPFGTTALSGSAVVTISSLPAITGNTTTCAGFTSTTALADGTSGGTWSSGNTGVATIGTSSPYVTGVSAGSAIITYQLSASCFVTTTETILPAINAITGSGSICALTTTTLGDLTPSGTWSSGNTTVATIVAGTGVVTGVSGGTDIMTYTSPAGCQATTAETVISSSAGTLSGFSIVCVGASTPLSSSSPGGTWASSNTAKATIGSSTGIVTGVAAGSAIMTYALTTTCGAYTATYPIAVGTVAVPTPIVTPSTDYLCSTSPAQLVYASNDTLKGSVVVSSTSASFTIPENAADTSSVTVSGVPAGATITSVVVTINVGNTASAYQSDNLFNLRGPDGSIINLDNFHGSSDAGFTNVTYGSAGTVAQSSSTEASGNLYIASLVSGAPTSGSFTTTSYRSNATAWSSLYAAPNGSWTLITDNDYNATEDTFKSWSITINYAYIPVVTWSPVSGLYTNTGATSSYLTGTNSGSVYALPTSTTTYTVTANVGGCSSSATSVMNVAPTLPAITGNPGTCVSSSTSLADIAPGGTWTSGSTGVATIGAATGLVTGVTTGSSIITYSLSGCIMTTTETVVAAINPITNGGSLCALTTTTLGDLTPSGTWSSNNTSVATVGASSGAVFGVNGGTSIITYTSPVGCTAEVTETVTPFPINGNAGTCIGSSTTLGDATLGGAWSSGNTAAATIGSGTGILTGVATGTTIVTYLAVGGCISTSTETIVAAILPITGGGSICATVTTTLGDLTPGGTWSGGNSAIATVGSSSGAVTGVSFGADAITYTSPVGCTTTTTETIIPGSISPITGSQIVCLGASTPLADVVPGGSWSSSITANATVNSSSGLVTGVAFGTSTISYNVSNSCGSFTATTPITVTTLTVPTPTITPLLASLCPSSPANLLYAYGDTVTSSFTSSMNTYAVEIENTADTSSIMVNGIPPGAVITNVSVTFKVNPKSTGSVYETDNGYNLRAPNGNILNLDNFKGANSCACGFNNVTIDSLGTVALPATALASGTSYIASKANGVPSAITAGYKSNVTNWASLFSQPNGTWTFIGDNDYTTLGEDTLVSWTIAVSYVLNPVVTWSPVTGLYTNTGGTTSYTGTSTSTIYALPTSTTTYTVTANIGGCTSSASVNALVNPTLYVPSITGLSRVCNGGTVSMTDSVTGGNWSSSNPAVATVGAATGVVTSVVAGTTTISYTYNSGSCSGFALKSFTVNAIPVIPAIGGTANLCLSSSTVTLLSDADLGGTWTSSNPSVATIGASSGVVNALATGTSQIIYAYSNGTCSNTTSTTVTVASSPSSMSVTPELASLCPSSPAQMLVANGGQVPGGPATTSSGTIALTIAYASSYPAGVTTSLNVTGIPSGATVTGIAVNLNATESFDGDLELNLMAPNAQVINLFSSGSSNSGANLLNTNISSAGTTAIPNLATGAPWTGTWAASANPTAGSSVYPQTTASWAPIEAANPNGTWVLVGRNNYPTGAGDVATLTNWSITISYSYQAPVTWLPVTGLFTNTAGTTPYTGTATNTVYALPTTTTLYTATGSNGACVSSASVNVHNSATLYVSPVTGASNVCMGLTNALSDSTIGGVWSSGNTAIAIVGTASGVVTPVAPGTAAVTYTYTNGSCSGTATKVITVNALPVVAAIGGPGTVCSGTTVTLTDTRTGGAWSSSSPSIVTIGTGSGVVTPVSPGAATISYTYSNGTCSNTATAPINSLNTPTPISITPSSSAICAGGPSDMLMATGGYIAGSVTASSASAPFLEGDYITLTYINTSSINISTIPPGSVITGVSVNFNVGATTGAYQSDDIFNLLAPNGSIINLDNLNGLGAAGYGFSNVTISSSGTTPLSTAQITSAYNYEASLAYGAGPSSNPSDFRSTSTSWSSLYSIPNGAWTFIPANNYSATEDTFKNWTITINYLAPANTTWASATGLFADSAATMPYSGASMDTVYALPATTAVYTVTASNGSCTSWSDATVTVNPLPAAIGGNQAVCMSSTSSLADGTVGGTWNSGNTTIATVDSVTGVISGINPGTSTVTYTLLGTGCQTMTTVTVNPLPNVYILSGGGNYCETGTGVDISLSGSDAGYSYQLYNGLTAVDTPMTGTGAALDFGLNTASGYYTIVSSNPATLCNVNMIGTDTITINALPNVHNVINGGSYCAGGAGVHIGLDGTDTGINYQLYNLDTAIGSAVAGTGSSIDFGLFTIPGSYTVVAKNGTYGCQNNMTGSADVSINPLPVVYMVSGSGSYCNGGTGRHIMLSGSNMGISYQLYINGASSGSALGGIDAVLDFGSQTDSGAYSVIAMDTATSCTDNMSDTAIITINPTPAIHSITGGGSYCAGGTGVAIGLNGSDTATSYQLYLSGSMTGSTVAGTGSPLSFGLDTSAGVYKVVATNSTATCTSNMTDSATIIVNPLPAVFTVTGGGNYCAGGTGVHVGLSGSDTGTNYQLFLSGTMTSSPIAGTGSPLSFGLDTSSGVYKVVATNSTGTCTSNMADSAAVIINPLPTVYTITGGGGYCASGTGEHIDLSGSSTGVNYRLFLAGAPVDTVSGTGSSLDFGLRAVAGVYTAAATNAITGCVSNMAGSTSITVLPLPTPYAVTGGGNYCAGGTGVHIRLASSTLGIVYRLYLAGSALDSAGGTGSSLDFGLATAAGIYTVVGIDTATTCTNNMAGSDTVNINPLVSPSVTIASGLGDAVCQGTNTTFTATPHNGGTAPIYRWRVDGFVEGTDSVSFSYVPTTGDVVTANLVSNAMCASFDTAYSDSVTMNVMMYETPTIHISATPGNQICQATPDTFSAATTYGGSAPSFSWLVNGVPSGSDSSYAYLPANGDVISCVLTSDYACKLATTIYSSDISMAVQTPIVPSVAIDAYPGENIQKGQKDSLVAVVTNGGTNPLYQWSIGHTPVVGATTATYIYGGLPGSDSVSCMVTRTDACELSTFNGLFITVLTTGVAQVTSGSADIMVVPNPNNGEFTIKGTLGITTDAEVSVEITDVLGQVIYSNKFMAASGDLNEQIKLKNNLANGMYILNLRSGDMNQVFHVVVAQ